MIKEKKPPFLTIRAFKNFSICMIYDRSAEDVVWLFPDVLGKKVDMGMIW